MEALIINNDLYKKAESIKLNLNSIGNGFKGDVTIVSELAGEMILSGIHYYDDYLDNWGFIIVN